MARIRTIKPEFFTDEQMSDLPHVERLLFIGLWCHADKSGRLEDRPRRLKGLIFPHEDCDVEQLLSDLANGGFIIRYVVNERQYVQIRTFSKHQRPHHTERESEIPPVPRGFLGRKKRLRNGENPRRGGMEKGMEKGKEWNGEGKGEGKEIPAAPRPATAAIWEAYSEAYTKRYHTAPTRNAKVNGMIARFAERVPADEAAAIAAFYVGHSGALYASSGHCVELLLRDAEKLHTEWITGERINPTVLRRNEQTSANPFLRLAEDERRKGGA